MMRVFSGISTIYISQIILSTARQGGLVHITKPLRTSSVPAPASLMSTFSPGRAAAPVETYDDYPFLGRFTLRTEGKTIAIGKIKKLPPKKS